MGDGAPQAAEDLVADLAPLGEVSSKKMFGGFGVFADGVMFALVDSDGGTFLRIAPGNDDRYGERHGRMPYGRIPGPVRDDAEGLLSLASLSLEAARDAKR